MFRGGLRLAHRAKSIYNCPSDAPNHYPKVSVLETGTVNTFRQEAFVPAIPATLPHGHFSHIRAINAWFRTPSSPNAVQTLNRAYLDPYGDTLVPLELTSPPSAPTPTPHTTEPTFRRFQAPFHLFLDWVQTANPATPHRLYLAQAQVTALPPRLRDDVPAPELVLKAGKGNIYDANVWIGLAPTYTPLHRDPNPNLFVQLAGTKVVRLFEPAVGAEIYRDVRAQLGRGGEGVLRGEEMMQGEEKRLLESEVWSARGGGFEGEPRGYEARLERGDGLFIPKGWWHSIKGVGEGITGSVSRALC